jgi:pyrroline-5-carboxylate reductase
MIVGFAGSGNMAAAMARGWASGDGGPDQMLFTDSGSGRAAALAAEVGGEALASNAELAQRSDLLMLAFKPKQLEEIAAEAQGADLVVSLLAAKPLEAVVAAFPGSTAMRMIPNLPVEVRRGVLCLAAGDAPGEEVARVRKLLEPLGRLVEMDDALIEQATVASSSSPAFFAVAVQAVAEGSAVDGLDLQLALSLSADAAAGTGKLLHSRTPDQVREGVASPGGMTEAGLEELARRGVAEAFAEAARAALGRTS